MMAIQISVSPTDAEEEVVDEVSEQVQSEICEQEHGKKMCRLWLKTGMPKLETEKKKMQETMLSVSASAMFSSLLIQTYIVKLSQVKLKKKVEKS